MKPGKSKTICWICAAPTPGGDDPQPECLDCLIAATGATLKRKGESGPWFFQHDGCSVVLIEKNPFKAFELMSDPTVDEIDEDLYNLRIEQGWDVHE